MSAFPSVLLHLIFLFTFSAYAAEPLRETMIQLGAGKQADQAPKKDPTNKLAAGAMHANAKPRKAVHVRERGPAHSPDLPSESSIPVWLEHAQPRCMPQDLLGQVAHLHGQWVLHENPSFQSYYGNQSACPAYTHDFDCLVGDGPKEHRNAELARLEFRKIFRPNKCDLRPFDAAAFDTFMAGRRLIMIGDSNMNGMFASLGCLMRSHGQGQLQIWDNPDNAMTTIKGMYEDRDGNEILKQTTGEIELSKGGRVIMRCFGRYSLQLWDDVIQELQPLTEQDTLVINWGAWYHRFYFNGGPQDYHTWRINMHELVNQRLAGMKSRIIWKGYTTFHYAGETGAFTGVQQELPQHVPPLQSCQPTTIGEFWFDEKMAAFLADCGKPCEHISILPLFDASLPLHTAHHGMFGRGRADGDMDCTHYCHNVLDQWVTMLYNALVPLSRATAST